MADPADTAATTHDATGQGAAPGVDTSGNDAFSDAFAAFAAGTPAPEIEDEEDEDADLDAGQGDANEGADPAPNGGSAADPPANAPAKPAAGSEEPDPWANASPALIAARDKLVREYEQKVQGASGRASGLQRQLNALTTGKPAAAAPQDATGQDGKGEEPSDAWKALDAKIKVFEEDYPEIAEIMVPLLKQQRDELADMRGKVAPVIEADNAQVVAAQQSALEGMHPDWRSFAPGANADFEGWRSAQPENVQKLADSWDPREVGVALTLFKIEQAEAKRQGGDTPPPKDKTATDTRRARQLDGGKVVQSRTAPAAAGAPDDFTGAFEHFASKIDKK